MVILGGFGRNSPAVSGQKGQLTASSSSGMEGPPCRRLAKRVSKGQHASLHIFESWSPLITREGSRSQLLLDVVNCVLDGDDRLDCVFWNLDAEVFFERH